MTLKAQLNVSISSHTIQELRSRAAEVGAPIGDLADTLLRGALMKTDVQALKTWAQGLESRRGRAGGALRADEKAALSGLRTVRKDSHHAKVFTSVEIARSVGLLLKTTHDALCSLQARGGFVGGALSSDLDRWGRPVESVWWLAEDNDPAIDHGALLEVVRGLRVELATLRVEPLAIGVMERAIRLRAGGWSPAALRFPEGDTLSEGQTYAVDAQGAIAWLSSRWPVSLNQSA
jgi:hypothetical protein